METCEFKPTCIEMYTMCVPTLTNIIPPAYNIYLFTNAVECSKNVINIPGCLLLKKYHCPCYNISKKTYTRLH